MMNQLHTHIHLPPQRFAAAVLLVLGFTIGAPAAQAQPADAPSVETLVSRAVNGGADPEAVQGVVRRARERGLSDAATAALIQPAADLAENDLPADAVLQKALEGLAKRVPPARMTPVLKQLQAHTQTAGQQVNAWLQRPEVQETVGAGDDRSVSKTARNQLVTTLARARRQGVPSEATQALLNTLPEATSRRPIPLTDVAVAVRVLPELPGGITNRPTARRLLTAALDAGYDARTLDQLPVALESARRAAGRPANVMARQTAQAIAQGTPATQVLQGLFQGALPGGGPPDVARGPESTPPGQGKPPGREGNPGNGNGPPDNPGNGGGNGGGGNGGGNGGSGGG